MTPAAIKKERVVLQSLIAKRLKNARLTLSLAESCTGGLASCMITDVPGSSEYFTGSVVAYSNGVKTELLGVRPSTLKKNGAVSEKTAVEMAEGVRKRLKTDVGVSITGIAGPGGGSKSKPVGTVYISVSTARKNYVKKFLFKGNRAAIKRQSAYKALKALYEAL